MESEASQTQPQPPSAGLIGLMAWAEVNKKRLAIGAGVMLLAIVVAIVVVQQQARKEISASEALSDVRIPYNPAQAAQPGTADALLKVANDYAGTKAAARALLISASLLYSEKSYDEAQKRYAKLIQDYPTSQWVPEASLGIAASIDAQGKSAEAIAKFEDIRKRFANSPAAEEAKLSVARLYEAQKPEEAYKLYEDIVKNGPGTSLAAEAEFRKEELERKRPELAKLKEPAMPTAMTPPLQMTNIIRRTNIQTLTMTNRPGATGQPVQIKLNPTPPPAQPAPAPAAAAPPPVVPAPPPPAVPAPAK